MNAYRVKRAKERAKARAMRRGGGGRSGVGIGEILVLLIVLVGALVAVNSPSFKHQDLRKGELFRLYTPDQLREDLAVIMDRLETLHPDLYAHVSREEIRDQRQKIEGELTAPMNRVDFYRLVAPLVANVGDPLTEVVIPKEERDDYIDQGALLLPLDLDVTADGVTVAHNYSSDSLLAAGVEVLSINNTPSAQLRDRLVQYVSGDSEPFRYWRLGNSWRELEWLVYGFESPYEVTVTRPGVRGRPVSRNVLGVLQGAIEEDRRVGDVAETAPVPWTYSFQRRESVGLVKVSEFENYPDLNQSVEKLVTDLEADGAGALILDLRGTAGAGLDAVDAFLAHITDKTVPLIDSSEVRATKTARTWYARSMPILERFYPPLFDDQIASLWKAQPGSMHTLPDSRNIVPAEKRYHGPVFVIIDNTTGPAAALFAGLVQSHGIGTLYGQTDAPAATGFYGEPFSFDLPNTRLRVQTPLERLVPAAARETVAPDEVVQPTNYERRRRLDSDLVRTLQAAGRAAS